MVPKIRDERAFVFCHSDLSPYNLMCDPKTLKITYVVDWEIAGFYDEEFLHLWTVDKKSYYDMFRDKDRLALLVALLEP